MGSTNKTPNLNLTQFLDADKPDWLTDYNGDMLKVDSAIRNLDPEKAVAAAGGIPSYTNIESGSNTNGKYIKYPDGTLVCTKIFTFTIPANGMNAEGTAFSYNFSISSRQWPVSFLQGSEVDVEPVAVSMPGARIIKHFTAAASDVTTLCPLVISVVSFSQSPTAQDYKIGYRATGRWK